MENVKTISTLLQLIDDEILFKAEHVKKQQKIAVAYEKAKFSETYNESLKVFNNKFEKLLITSKKEFHSSNPEFDKVKRNATLFKEKLKEFQNMHHIFYKFEVEYENNKITFEQFVEKLNNFMIEYKKLIEYVNNI